MSYMQVLSALDPSDVVTFNDSGGANASTSPELTVQNHTNSAIQEFKESNGELWRLKKKDNEIVLQYDRESCDDGTGPRWRDFDIVETVEVIAESEKVSTETRDQRECPDCGGRQIRIQDRRTSDPFWICTDTHCDRRDEIGVMADGC